MSTVMPTATTAAGTDMRVRTGAAARLRVRSALPGIMLLLVLLAAWIAVKYGAHVSEEKMPAPLEVVKAGWTNHAQLLKAAGQTIQGALEGFFAGSILAVLAAILVASSTVAARLLLPLALVIRTLPIVAIAPLLTLLVGYGSLTIVIISAMIIFFPTLVNAILGLRSVSSEAIELMAMANASRVQVLWKLRLPTALPYIFSGLQIGAATCILGAMVAEWVTTGNGLGYLILLAGTEFEVPLMWAGVIVSAVMAIIVFLITGWVARRVIYDQR
jgi:NitT/TauT family transport system permease protein